MAQAGLPAAVFLFAISTTPLLVAQERARLANEPSGCPCSGACRCRTSAAVTTYRSGAWLIRETANFRICSRFDSDEIRELPARCESFRQRLGTTWLGEMGRPAWSPKCDVLVHASLAEYCRALGCSDRSVGCTTIEVEGGKVRSRRIDVRTDAADWAQGALPHELTHVVLADRFAGRRLPRWADEGMGVLAESESKQSQRRQALRTAMARGSYYGLQELLSLDRPPSAAHRDAFYGQSAALVRFLVERDSTERFVEFVELATRKGYDDAMRACYSIEGTAALEALWHREGLPRAQTLVSAAADSDANAAE